MMLVDIVFELGWKVCVEYREVKRVANVSGKSRLDMLSLPESVVVVKKERI